MAHGIETDNKKYKHFRRDDEKWLFTDLYEMKRISPGPNAEIFKLNVSGLYLDLKSKFGASFFKNLLLSHNFEKVYKN